MIGRKRIVATRSSQRSKRARLYKSPSMKKFLLGNKVSTTVKYVHYGQLNPGAVGTPATYVFSANGLYDPDITGVGHQPRGFDQLIALYDHYHVTSAQCILTVLQSADQAGSIVGIQLKDDPTPSVDMIQAMENRFVSYKGLTRGNGATVVKQGFNSKSFFDLNDRQLYGSNSANPSDQAFFVVFAQPTYAVDIGAVEFMVEIRYTVTFSEPNDVASS